MEDKQIVVNVVDNGTGANLTIREGEAPKILETRPPITTNLSGVIGSPVEFLTKRISEDEQINQKRCHVIVDRANVSITLITNENDSYLKGSVKGKLEEHPKFVQFGINKGKNWQPNELGQFFKMHRAFFADLSENMMLVTKLTNFNADINSKIEKEKNENGSFKDNYSGVVTSNLPPSFKLKIPVFKGVPADTIEVEFYASIDGREVSLQLFSPGANQLLEYLRDQVIDEEIKQIKELAPDIAIIEQ